MGSKSVRRKQNFFYSLPIFLLNVSGGGSVGHGGGGDANIINSLVFHNLKQGDLLVTLADFPVTKTSMPAKTHQFAITTWGLWEILSIYWKEIFMEETEKPTCGLFIQHPCTKSMLKKMDSFSTRRKHLL